MEITGKKAITFQKQARHKWLFRTSLMQRLPLAWFSGIRIGQLNADGCTVYLPGGFRTRNPFGSVYFAAMAIAAEMSTGALVMLHTLNTDKSCSMLVTGMQATFLKKSKGPLVFECLDGLSIDKALQTALQNNAPAVIRLRSVAFDHDGSVITDFTFEWSIKFR